MKLSDFLAVAGQQDDQESKPTILPEAAIERMREHAVRYAEQLEGPRFKIGDLVTPLPDGVIKGAGNPHLVVDLLLNPRPTFDGGGPGQPHFGNRLDMRVLRVDEDGDILAHWSESRSFEAWKPKP